MLSWENDLYVSMCGLYLDSRHPRPRCFISHGHTDHLGAHETALCTAATARICQHRLPSQNTRVVAYNAPLSLTDDCVVRLTPAGHVLGSAMLHVQASSASLLYTGDFKLRESLTVERASPIPADVLVMESTYGKPVFRFPSWREVHQRLTDMVGEALREGRQPIVLGYSLGKAQEILRILTAAGFRVTCHGAVATMNDIYEQFGVALGPWRRYVAADFHGKRALPLEERGVLVAPPQVARTSFVERFDRPLQVMMSGWGMLKGAQYRYGVDHVLPLSDHADFDELLELIEQVNPKEVYTHHGFTEFVDHLRARGITARLARPPAQMELFE